MGDAEFKRRRYCLLCHVFKPERTHHCSVCNRCVLNMDHHCPWINNCVGFHNRKIFILLLFYGLINLYQILLLMLPIAYNNMLNLLNSQETESQLPYLNIGATVFILCLTLLLSMFSRFHFRLVLENSTTIEKADTNLPVGLYDKGLRHNWMQIFGQDARIWLLPIYGRTGLPLGDGVIWQSKSEEQEVKNPSERSSEGTVRTPKRVSGLPNDMMNLRQTSEAYRQVQPSFVKSDVDTDTSFITPIRV